jgi:D-hydroxyproline dehydrogenase subunit gamma
MSGFRRIEPKRATLTLQVDGRPIAAAEGDTVATALLAAGAISFSRNAKSGASNAPYCLIGICFGCLCSIDGRPGMQACLVPVRDGMVVLTEAAADLGEGRA